MFKIPDLRELQVNGKEKSRSQQQKHKPVVSADIAVQRIEEFVDKLHQSMLFDDLMNANISIPLKKWFHILRKEKRK